MQGYNHIRSKFEEPEARASMNMKLKIFTVCWSLMCIENTFRVLDFTMNWQFVIKPERPDDLDFSSEYDITYSDKRRTKLTMRMDNGPGAIAQTQFCMVVMILNNLIWWKRGTFSAFWHTIHYFVASVVMVLYIPRLDWWPVMMGPKYGYTNMNIFIYQLVLGTICGLTSTHHFIALLGTMTYQVINVKIWYDVGL